MRDIQVSQDEIRHPAQSHAWHLFQMLKNGASDQPWLEVARSIDSVASIDRFTDVNPNALLRVPRFTELGQHIQTPGCPATAYGLPLR